MTIDKDNFKNAIPTTIIISYLIPENNRANDRWQMLESGIARKFNNPRRSIVIPFHTIIYNSNIGEKQDTDR